MILHRLISAAMLLLFSATGSFAFANGHHMADAAGVAGMHSCLRCHQNTMFKSGTIHFGNYCMLGRGSYPPAGKERDYAEAADVEKAGCVLEEGRVTCLSCHDLTRPRPYVRKEGYKLCSICHLNLKTIR